MTKSKSRFEPYGKTFEGILCLKFYANTKQFLSTNELEVAIIKEWPNISEFPDHLLTSMKNRVFEVIRTNRRPILYYFAYYFQF